MGKSILYDFSPQELQQLLDTACSYSSLLRAVGLNPKGENPETLKRIIREYGLDETQLNINRHNLYIECAKRTNQFNRSTMEDIFNNKVGISSTSLLHRLVDENYKEYRCEKCGIIEWNDKAISLQLHHKDGNHNNNSLNNLAILCPNCHSQTDNFAGKSSKHKKIKRTHNEVLDILKPTNKKNQIPISRDKLKDLIRKTPFTRIAKEYDRTDNAIRKWCKKYNLPFRSSDIKQISDEDWEKI